MPHHSSGAAEAESGVSLKVLSKKPSSCFKLRPDHSEVVQPGAHRKLWILCLNGLRAGAFDFLGVGAECEAELDALKFYSTIRIDVRRGEPIKVGKENVGNRTKITIKKNKVAPPFRSCVVDVLYGQGISVSGELLDLGVEMDLIQKSGSFYSYDGERIGQGKDNARKYITSHPDIFDALDKAIRLRMSDNPDILDETMLTQQESTSEDEDGDEFELDEVNTTGSLQTDSATSSSSDNDVTMEELENAI